jgi:phosphoserine phosphatase
MVKRKYNRKPLQKRHTYQQTIAVEMVLMITYVELSRFGIAFHAKAVKTSSSISSLGLDGVLYLLGYHDRHIDMMEELP